MTTSRFITGFYLTGPERYFAENINEPGKMEFYFGLVDGEWTAEDPGYQRQAEQIGEEVDKIT